MAVESEQLWNRDFLLAILCRMSSSAVFSLLTATIAAYSMRTYGVDAGLAGLCVGVFIIGALISRMFAGRYVEVVGRKRMLVAGTAAFTAMSLAYHVPVALPAFIVIRFAHGLTFGVANNTVNVAVTGCIPRKRWGEGMGYYGIAVSLASAIGPFLGVTLMNDVGFPTMFLACTACSAVSLAAACMMRIVSYPLTAGQRAEILGRLRLSSLFERGALPISVFTLMCCICYASVTAFANTYSAEIGLEDWSAAFFVVVSLAMLASRPFVGRIYDTRGQDIVLVPSLVTFVAALAMMGLCGQNPTLLLVSGALVGIGFGTLNSTAQIVALKSSPEDRVGTATATFFALSDCGLGLGPTVMGRVAQSSGYSGMYLVTAAVIANLTAVYIFARFRTRRK